LRTPSGKLKGGPLKFLKYNDILPKWLRGHAIRFSCSCFSGGIWLYMFLRTQRMLLAVATSARIARGRFPYGLRPEGEQDDAVRGGAGGGTRALARGYPQRRLLPSTASAARSVVWTILSPGGLSTIRLTMLGPHHDRDLRGVAEGGRGRVVSNPGNAGSVGAKEAAFAGLQLPCGVDQNLRDGSIPCRVGT